MSTNILAITLREAPWQNLADDIVIDKASLEPVLQEGTNDAKGNAIDSADEPAVL